MLIDLQTQAPNASVDSLKTLLSFGLAVQSADASANLPDFPLDNLHLVAKIMVTHLNIKMPAFSKQTLHLQNVNGSFSLHDAISLLYPYQTTLKKEHKDRIANLLKTLKISTTPSKAVKAITIEQPAASMDTIKFNIDKLSIRMPAGQRQSRKPDEFVDLPHQRNILANMIQAFAVGDICLIGICF